jgi:hypothetical protein
MLIFVFKIMNRLLVISLLLMGACAPKPSGVKVDPSLDTLVPPDTVLLVGTRLEKLLKSPIYQKNFAGRQIPQIEDFARRTGLDPRKDLWELLFVSDGKQGVLLGRGKFADEMMEPKLENEGAKRSPYKGFNLYTNDQGAVMFINPTTAALGRVDELHSLIDHKAEAHGPPPALAALMKELPPDAQFWAAYAGGPIHLPIDENSNLANVNKLVSAVQTGSLFFDLRYGLGGVVTANCANDEGAEQVEGALRALIGVGRLSVPKDQPDLAQVYNLIRVTRESRRVRLYIDVPEAMVDKFLGMWMGHK